MSMINVRIYWNIGGDRNPNAAMFHSRQDTNYGTYQPNINPPTESHSSILIVK